MNINNIMNTYNLSTLKLSIIKQKESHMHHHTSILMDLDYNMYHNILDKVTTNYAKRETHTTS